MAADFDAGLEIVRALAQKGVAPDVFRLSDREETRMSLAMSGTDGLATARLRLLPAPARPQRGLHPDLRLERRPRVGRAPPQPRRARDPRRRRPRTSGQTPGASWERGRFEGPLPARDAARPRALRRDARDLAHVVAPRRALRGGRRRAALVARRARGRPGIVLCHVSHLYPDGASLYFTWIARAAHRRRARAVARRQGGRLRGDRRRAAARSPTTTPSAATTSPTWPPRSASSGSTPCARSRSGSTPPGS